MDITELVETVSNLLQRKVGYVLHTSVGVPHGLNSAAVFLRAILILERAQHKEKHTLSQVYSYAVNERKLNNSNRSLRGIMIMLTISLL